MRKILALIMAILMMMTLFVGCTDVEVNVDDIELEEMETQYTLLLDAYCDSQGNCHELEYVEFGEKQKMSSISIIVTETGKTIGETFAQDGYEDLVLIEESDENFLGWMEYEITIKVDEDGCEYNTYKKTTEDLFTTQEVLNKTMPEQSMGYIAKWKDVPQEEYDFFEEIE